jgi:hypothetical protein
MQALRTDLRGKKKIRAADAKEVGMGNPSEETCCRPNQKLQITGNKLKLRAELSTKIYNFLDRFFPESQLF